jgi:hypothetical protein
VQGISDKYSFLTEEVIPVENKLQKYIKAKYDTSIDLDKIKDRKLIKYCVMICLFSKSYKNAVKTILYKFFNNNASNKEYVEFLLNEIIKKHFKIKHFFFMWLSSCNAGYQVLS